MLLEVHPDSGFEEIKRAYHKQVKQWHPDLNPSPRAHEQFIRINEAYEKITADLYLKSLIKRNRNDADLRYRYFYHTMRHHSPKSTKIDFTDTCQGRMIYISVHLLFVIIGFLVFINPLMIVVSKNLDPYKTIADSITNICASMLFGIAMTYFVSRSLFSFIRRII